MHAAFPGFECKQINYSEMDPGVIKAFHVHRRQTDVWFVPPGDKMLLVLVDVRAGSPTEKVVRRLVLGEGAARLVRIPPGVAHGVKNLAASRGMIPAVQLGIGTLGTQGNWTWQEVIDGFYFALGASHGELRAGAFDQVIKVAL